MTKPFQSIRELVGRVGSLLGGKTGDSSEASHQYSTLGIGRTNLSAEPSGTEDAPGQADVRVFVEAPVMESFDSDDMHEKTCQPDIDLQTADTKKLHAVEAEAASPDLESSHAFNFPETDNSGHQVMHTDMIHADQDSFLDLGVGTVSAASASDDFVLDLGSDSSPTMSTRAPVPVSESSVPNADLVAARESVADESTQAEELMPSAVTNPDWVETAVTTAAVPAIMEEKEERLDASRIAVSDLSPEAIDAIARRAVEHLSEKVVREIAWEVVPELAELLIKQKLEEQK